MAASARLVFTLLLCFVVVVAEAKMAQVTDKTVIHAVVPGQNWVIYNGTVPDPGTVQSLCLVSECSCQKTLPL